MDAAGPRSLVGFDTAGAGTQADDEARAVTALVERAKGGDAEAFDDLMRLYEGRIIALGIQMGLSRDDALDACQNAFVRVFRFIARFRTGESFFKWLYRIAVNAIYDQMRQSRRSGVVSMEELDDAQYNDLRDSTPTPLAQVEASLLAGKLRDALDCLTRRERTIFVLRDLNEMGSAEIGAILRLSQVTVRRHCMSARQKLKKRLLP